MGLSMKGYGIHGTNAPRSIGKAASHGCIRMRQADLEELFELVEVGSTVVEISE
jgi:lipoprotein-anchoring transpeptidase ErfK/SrfK